MPDNTLAIVSYYLCIVVARVLVNGLNNGDHTVVVGYVFNGDAEDVSGLETGHFIHILAGKSRQSRQKQAEQAKRDVRGIGHGVRVLKA